MADNPKVAATVWTAQPELMPSIDATPTLRPWEMLRPTIEGIRAEHEVQQQAAGLKERRVLGSLHGVCS